MTVVKEWNVPEGTGLPGSILVNLLADEEAVQEAELTADNNWTHTWPEQPKMNEDGSEIVYTVEEELVEGYESSVSEPIETDTGIEIAITNTLIEEEPASTINVTVAKSWEAPEDVELPESVTVYLKVNGRRVDDYRTILNKENKWTYTWRGLPEFDSDGEYYVYGVDEVAVEGYETIIGDPGRTTESTILFEITNKLKEDPTQPDIEDKLYPVVITKVLKGISAKDLPEGTVFNFVVIDGNNGDTQESAVITREELIAGNGTASTTIMTKYKGGMRIGEEIASAQLSAYEWVGTVAVSGDAEYQEIDKAYDVKPFACTGMIKPETGETVVTYTNEYTPVKVELPKTGDDSHLALWLAMLGMAGAAMLMLRKRHEA